MKTYSNTKQPSLEFDKDTVYVRSNFVQNDTGWEYDEIRYTYPEYIKTQQENQETIMLALAELAKEAL